MRLFKLTRTDKWGYDDYDEIVVAAPDEASARRISPNDHHVWSDEQNCWLSNDEPVTYNSWCERIDTLRVKELGTANSLEPGLILASFNAG
jgi:hypothetical protein